MKIDCYAKNDFFWFGKSMHVILLFFIAFSDFEVYKAISYIKKKKYVLNKYSFDSELLIFNKYSTCTIYCT